ncbi:MAG: 4-hydroxy-tetrahydrodipicolinate synthase [Hydrogenoanaerobacterium sp.]
MKKTIFTGSGVAIITPMNSDGSINYDELSRIISFQLINHTDAIIICGTTGESSTMSDEEHIKAIGFTVDHVAGRVPVIAGAGSNDTAYAIWLSKEAAAVKADALLQVTPYYNKTSQAGLVRHFNTIADATALPIILYNVPSRTGMDISVASYTELAKHPNIVATKEASGNISKIAQVAQACGESLAIYSGNDDEITPILALGGKGVISVLANVMPQQTHDICKLFFDGKAAESTALQLKLLPLINALFSDVNPMPVKEAMNLCGWNAGKCRLPLIECSEGSCAMLKKELSALGLLK